MTSSNMMMGQDAMYALIAGAIVEMTPLRSIVPGLPPVVHSALAGAIAKPMYLTATAGVPFNFPDCMDTKQAGLGAAGGFVANMYM